MAYSLEQKAIAIAIANRHGEVNQKALSEIHATIGNVDKKTIYRWLASHDATALPLSGKPDATAKKVQLAEAVQEADYQLEQRLHDILDKYSARALTQDVINEMKGRELATAFGIYFDKLRLLQKLPTEIVGLLPDAMDALAILGLNPGDFFNALIAKAHANRESVNGLDG